MNDTGEAALCYFDAAGMQSFLATLARRSDQWVTHQMACSDPHIDAAGDVFASVGTDANNKFSAATLIGGQIRNEIIDPNVAPGDEFAVGLSAGGTALARGRDNNQKPLVYLKANLASSGGWQNAGPLALGTPFVAYSAVDSKSGFLNIFKANVPGSALPLAPGLGPYDVPSLTSIAVDAGGDVLVLLSVAGPPQTVPAVFGDFSSPTLRLAVPHHVRAGHRVLLRSGATDGFPGLSSSEIRWKLPPRRAAGAPSPG